MQETLDWNALRWVLAIGRAGSLAGAARALDVSHATIFRRLNAVERALGVSLFVRERRGYRPTAAGTRVIAEAEMTERRLAALEQTLQEGDAAPAGPVRITTTDTLFEGLLAPVLAALRSRYPAITLEVAISNQAFNLSRRQADIAIRPMARPPDALIAYRLGRIEMACYESAEAGPDAPWLGLDDSVYFPALAQWTREQGIDDTGWRLDTLLGLTTAARAGAGRAVLPCYLADTDSALRRCGAPIAALATDLWLLVHPDLGRVGRMRAVRDAIREAIGRPAMQARLAGARDQAG